MTREQWLNELTNNMRPLFVAAGAPLPEKLRVTCGWPSVKGLGAKKRRVGECWNPECSTDGTTEVFISPFLGEAAGPQGVASTLYHELIHAAVGTACGHKGAFVVLAKKLGLEGPWTATVAPAGLMERLEKLLPGKYPHATLDASKLAVEKKQGTRMLKCECGACGYTCRTTKKWLEDAGAPICPCNGTPMTAPESDPCEENEDSDDMKEAA